MIRKDFSDLFSLSKSLPNSWAILKMKQIVSAKITDGPHETPELIDEGIPFISAEAIKNDRINFDLKRGYISEELHKEYSKKCKPQRNDIFIIKSGATTGNVAYVDVDVDFNIWSPLAVVRCDEKIAHYKFVYYQLLSDIFRKQVELSWSFGTQENIGMGVIERLNVIIPGIVEQNLIFTYLDKQCAAIDKVIEIKKEQLTILDELRKSIIHNAVTKGLDDKVELVDSGVEWVGKIPKGWKVGRLKSYTEINQRTLGGETDPAFSFYYIDIGNVDYEKGYEKGGVIEFGNAPSRARRKVKKGDTIISTVRTYLKAIAYLNEPAEDIIVSTGFAVVTPRPNLITDKFLNYYLRSHFSIEKISSLSTGVGYPAIDSVRLPYIPVVIPNIEEQNNITRYLDQQWERILELKSSIKQQIKVLQQYRLSLIHECVTGKRRITEQDLEELANVSGS